MNGLTMKSVAGSVGIVLTVHTNRENWLLDDVIDQRAVHTNQSPRFKCLFYCIDLFTDTVCAILSVFVFPPKNYLFPSTVNCFELLVMIISDVLNMVFSINDMWEGELSCSSITILIEKQLNGPLIID